MFVTLDPTSRRLRFPRKGEVILTDTVGFIRDLPHPLVPAFAATLEAARDATLVLHVIDVARPSAREDFRAVEETLEEQVFSKHGERPPILNVLNKIDLAPEFALRDVEGIPVSARNGIGLDALRDAIAAIVYPGDREVELLVPHTAVRSLAFLRARDRIVAIDYVEDGARFRGRLSPDEVAAAEAAGARVT
jgi:GTP-binding protein HflX